jgi:hypothetical protein
MSVSGGTVWIHITSSNNSWPFISQSDYSGTISSNRVIMVRFCYARYLEVQDYWWNKEAEDAQQVQGWVASHADPTYTHSHTHIHSFYM